MTEPPEAPPPEARHKAGGFRPFTAEDASKARARQAELRSQRKAARVMLPLSTYSPALPAVQSDASRAVVGHILADEIAWRSSILGLVGEMRDVLLADIRGKLYDTEKVTLPALIREARSLLELELKVIETTKSLNPDSMKRGQIADLLAREELMREQLTARGLLGPDGKLKALRPGPTTTEESDARPPDPSSGEQPGGGLL